VGLLWENPKKLGKVLVKELNSPRRLAMHLKNVIVDKGVGE
jgi:hypothetical protein